MTKAKKAFYFIAFLQAPKLFILIYFNHLMPIFLPCQNSRPTYLAAQQKKLGKGQRKIKTTPRQINKNAAHFCCGAFYAHLHSLTHTHKCKQVWAGSHTHWHT